VEIRAEAALFPEKEYISGIFRCSVMNLQDDVSGFSSDIFFMGINRMIKPYYA
jgi:hypothetical protein